MRYYKSGNSIVFTKFAMIFYHTFGETYRGLTLIQTRRKLKKVGYTHGAQDEILHYLKQEKYIKDEQ
jgi:hypothetical protein